jgi:hypothetical protein
MIHRNWHKATLVAMTGAVVLAGCALSVPPSSPSPSPPPRVVAPPPANHPAYLHALSDLRAARWLIEHRPGDDWAQSTDEQDAVRQIDAAINDIKQAAIDDGKNLNDHPPPEGHTDHRGRLHEAMNLLRKARSDVAREEDYRYANGLRDRAVAHIDGAIRAGHRVFND